MKTLIAVQDVIAKTVSVNLSHVRVTVQVVPIVVPVAVV
jgi:hypothetical protein